MKRPAKRLKSDADQQEETKVAQHEATSSGEARVRATSASLSSPLQSNREGVELSNVRAQDQASAGLSAIADVAAAAAASRPTSESASVAKVPISSELSGIHEKTKHDEKWNGMFRQLQSYKTQNDTTNVKQDEGKLGRWVHYQRVEYGLFQQSEGKGKITQERVDELDRVGFEWDPQKTQWEAMFNRLVEFNTQHGHCNVNKSYPDKKLANWVRNQRLEYSSLVRGRKSRMTEERRSRLDEMNFKWTSSPEDSATSESQST